jgi:glycosyltransferase involved in cell wall biosynthesis
MKTLIFFPTFNEAGNVASMIGWISRAMPDAHILIVDDNSADGTRDILVGLKNDKLTLLVRPSKLGIGTAHLLAWAHALHHGYDLLVTMDGDHSHDPADVPKLVAKLNDGHDLVVGSRYMPGGRCDYAGYRRWLSRGANSAARLFLQIEVSEFTNSFRVFRVAKLAEIDFADLLVSGYSFFFMTIVQANVRRLRIAEIPIHFHNRNAGTSKIPPLELFRGLQNLIRLAVTSHLMKSTTQLPHELIACEACGCEYSRLILHSGVKSKGVGPALAAADICLFCGDRSAAR